MLASHQERQRAWIRTHSQALWTTWSWAMQGHGKRMKAIKMPSSNKTCSRCRWWRCSTNKCKTKNSWVRFIFDDVLFSLIIWHHANKHDGALADASACVPQLNCRFEFHVGRTSFRTATRVVLTAKLPTTMDEPYDVAWDDGGPYLPASTLADLANERHSGRKESGWKC